MKKYFPFFCLIACGPGQKEEIPLPGDYYDWTCKDYQDYTEVIVTTETCSRAEDGVYFLIAEAFLINGSSFKRHLTEDKECSWSTEIVFIDEICMEVDGVTLTAIVDESTYFFEE